MSGVPPFTIAEYNEACVRYNLANPNRKPFSDLIAYGEIEARIYDPSVWSMEMEDTTTLDLVWAKVLETETDFDMEYGYEYLSEHINEFLTKHNFWREEN